MGGYLADSTGLIQTFGLIWFLLVGVLPLVVCVQKGKWRMGLLGFLLFGPLGIIGAIRLAKPDSSWAKRYYGDEKMERSRSRFLDLDQRQRLVRSEATSPDDATWRCTACGAQFDNDEDAFAHADSDHTELRFEDAKAALEKL